MTARDVFELSLALIDELEDDGSISEEDTAGYAGRAPAIIDVLQRELAFYEGKTLTARIGSLDDTMQISDDTAERILPYGLAAAFALADKNGDMYNDCSVMYRTLIRTIRADETDISDEYGVMGGLQ